MPWSPLIRRRPGWLALSQTGEELCLIHVQAEDERPRVRCLACSPADRLAVLRKRLALGAYRGVVLLQGGEYQLLQTEAPGVPRPEWKEALRWRLKDMVDFPVAEAVFDVLDIPTAEYAPTRQRSAFVVAAARTAVATRISPWVAAGLAPAAIDIPETAQRNIAALFEEDNRGLACLAFDEASALLTVNFRGELYASRRIEVSPAQIAAADHERRAQLFERVALETQRTLDSFDRQFSFITVSRLVVAAGPELEGLYEVLAANLYLPLAPLDLGEVLSFDDGPELADPGRRARSLHAIGAALRVRDEP